MWKGRRSLLWAVLQPGKLCKLFHFCLHLHPQRNWSVSMYGKSILWKTLWYELEKLKKKKSHNFCPMCNKSCLSGYHMQIMTNNYKDHIEEFLNVSKAKYVLYIIRRENIIRCNVIQHHQERSSRKFTLIIPIVGALYRSILK